MPTKNAGTFEEWEVRILQTQPSFRRRPITVVARMLIAWLLIGVHAALTQQRPARAKEEMRAPMKAHVRLTLRGDLSWSDTGVDVVPGDSLVIHAKPELGPDFANSSQCDP